MGVTRGYYLLYWGWVLQRLIDTRRGLKLIEQALEIGQSQDRQLELETLNDMAAVYGATRQYTSSCYSENIKLDLSGHPFMHQTHRYEAVAACLSSVE